MCKKVVFFSFLLCYLGVCFAQEKLKLTLYYESLCPYSMEFIQNQLQPTYNEMSSVLTLDLVPYGKTKHQQVHGKWKTTCQHGPKECYADRVQACILGWNNTDEVLVNTVLCIMSTENPESNSNIKKCVRKYKQNWPDIKRCVKSEGGDEYVSYFGNRTASLQPKLPYVPYILFNDVFDSDVEDEARDNLHRVVCDKLQNKPIACQAAE